MKFTNKTVGAMQEEALRNMTGNSPEERRARLRKTLSARTPFETEDENDDHRPL